MSKSRRLILKTLGIIFFLLGITSILVTLFAVSGTGRSPGLFMAVVLAGLGKWLWGKSEGRTAQETFGRAIDVADTDNSPDVAKQSK